ncbi:RHS repeat-associated core domain-containing protein [Burkholderia pyrrocinia]|uniref:RHS repeat-associated core domain-containing protein n=1 Tax=Burkholderia pyrrocinia TaxID=60550 RepID=UPI002AB03EE8|nr:RHS repeat-associated core domain-containing protein [Burkholderia pyrrocinia]
MALPAVKHLDPVVGIDVHSVLVTPGTPPVFLPHPHVGFMLDKREYIQAAKAVVGCIATMIAQEKVNEFIEDHSDDVEELEHLIDEANQQVSKQLNEEFNGANGLGGLSGLMGGGKLPDFKNDPTVAEGMKLAKEAKKYKNRISDDLGSNVGSGGSSGRPIFVNGMMRATAGTHAYHVPGLHFPLGESFVPPPTEKPEPSNDGESFMGSKTVLANNDPMSYMALEALSCWSVGMEPPQHNSAHTDRTYPSMPSSVMLPIPAGRPVLVGGPPIMNMVAAAKGLFKGFQGSKWAKALADKLHLKSGFLRCNVLKAEPVDVTTGEVVVEQSDFTVPGRLPLVWNRYYASHARHAGATGFGWQTPAVIRLELMRNDDGIGASAHFPDHVTAFDTLPQHDGWQARTYDWQHGHALYYREERMVLRTRDDIEYEFELPSRWRNAVTALDGDSRLTLLIHRIADLNGNAWVFERDVRGGLVRLVEWKRDGQTERVIKCDLGHGPRAGLLTSLMLIDGDGKAHPLVSYEYDHDRNLTTVIDAMAHPYRFKYTTGHRMVSHTSARGVSFYYSYQQDANGVWRVDHAWGDNGVFDYRFIYDRVRMETYTTNSLGYTALTQMNERGMPVMEIDPLGGVIGYRYDSQGRTNAVIDPVGCTTTWQYDTYANVLVQTLPDGSAVHTEYDNDHRPVCITAPVSRQWRYEWDARGNLIAQTTPSQAISRYAYDAYGQLISHTGPRNTLTQFEYDHAGNVAMQSDALGNRMYYTHDVRGNVIQVINAFGQVGRYEYDFNNKLTRSVEPGGREIQCTYDADGNLVGYRNPAGNLTQIEYSILGEVVKRTNPDGNVVEYRYDTEGQLIGVVNERCELYELKRDELGRVVEEVDYWGQSRRYEYGPSGNLRHSTDPLGRVINYSCDVHNRVVRKEVPDPRQPEGKRVETFSYDQSGELVMAENSDCRVELRYDSEGRIIEERQGDDFTISFAYDASGNRIERRTNLSTDQGAITHIVRYGYDLLDAVTSIQIDDATPITLERDAIGQVILEHLTANQRRELTYGADGQIAMQALLSRTGTVFKSEYTYDASDELIERRDSRLEVDRFKYDPVGRVTHHVDPTGKLYRFLRDPVGDLLKTRIRQGFDAGGAPSEKNSSGWAREGEYDDCHYTFDLAGNLVRKRGEAQNLWLLWDGDGLLIETHSETLTTSGTSHIHTKYVYDAFHRRTAKYSQAWLDGAAHVRQMASPPTASYVSHFFWDGDALTSELAIDESKTIGVREQISTKNCRQREWIYYPGTFEPIAIIYSSLVGNEPIHPNGDIDHQSPHLSPISLSGNKRIYFYHNDLNGTPIRVTDSFGRVMWEQGYPGLDRVNNFILHQDFDQPVRLQGQYFDQESGLHYNRHRYFDPSLGYFISQDPIGLEGGVNPYAFAPNMFRWLDPLGLIHGNSKTSKKKNHVYVIYNRISDEVYKFGISSGRVRLDGKSCRAESQVRKLNLAAGGVYESRVMKDHVTRVKALNIEQGMVNSYSVAAQRLGITKGGRFAPGGTPISPVGNIRPSAQM